MTSSPVITSLPMIMSYPYVSRISSAHAVTAVSNMTSQSQGVTMLSAWQQQTMRNVGAFFKVH